MSSCGNAKYARSWKGKGRAIDPAGYRLVRRADASSTTRPAGEDGVVLPLTMIQASSYETIYTLPIQVGTSGQTQVLSVQVDSGSSDLWLASTSCGSSACKQTGGHLYDPSHARPTGQTFQITYVEGEAVGPIVWDQVDIGGYTVDTQAVAAASTVDDEPLSTDFNGVLGIALPANSVIASCVPPTTGNAPDGAVFASNLFSMTPASTAPSARFLSLSLARPEDNGGGTKSQLGIGKHPPELVTDPSKVEYDNLSNPANTVPYFWQAQLSGISVWVDGAEKVVDIGKSAKSSQSLPTAIIDSGMPVILTSRTVANALYGALGIGPGSDGQYYVSCTQPLNMTVTLDGRTAIPLHPLDLTVGAAGNCMGMIQAYPSGSSVSDVGDVILGVPFMRSAYTVMAYDVPDAHGIFPNASQSRSITHPRLGLLGLTDPTRALDEFHTVRVLNQPLTTGENQAGGGSGSGGGSSSGGSGGGSMGKSETGGGRKLSVGLEVLIGILGFFGLCFVLFGVRWAVHRRRLARMGREGVVGHERSGSWESEEGGSKEGGEGRGEGGQRGSRGEYMMQQQAAMRLVRQSTMSSPYGLSEDTLRGSRASRYEELKKVDSSSTVPRSDIESGYFEDTARTRVGDAQGESGAIEEALRDHPSDRELGLRTSVAPADFDRREGDMGTWAMGNDTLVDGATPRTSFYPSNEDQHDRSYFNLPVRDEYPHTPRTPYHSHAPSADAAVAVPLLAHTRDESLDEQGAARRQPLGLGRPPSRARVGSFGSDEHPPQEFALADFDPGFDGSGNSRTSMAGIGRSRIASLYQPPVPRPQHTPRSSSVSAPLMSPPPLVQLSPKDDAHSVPPVPPLPHHEDLSTI